MESRDGYASMRTWGQSLQDIQLIVLATTKATTQKTADGPQCKNKQLTKRKKLCYIRRISR